MTTPFENRVKQKPGFSLAKAFLTFQNAQKNNNQLGSDDKKPGFSPNSENNYPGVTQL